MAHLRLELILTEPQSNFRDLEHKWGNVLTPHGHWRVTEGTCGAKQHRTGWATGNYTLEQCFCLFVIFFFFSFFFFLHNFRDSQDRNSCDFDSICFWAVQQAFLVFFIRVSNELKFYGRLLTISFPKSYNCRYIYILIKCVGTQSSYHSRNTSDGSGSSLMFSCKSVFPLQFKLIHICYIFVYLFCFLA